MANQKRIGRQTPTQSVIIPYQKTLSDEAVAYYERSGLSCYEWQKNLLDPIMAVDDDVGTPKIWLRYTTAERKNRSHLHERDLGVRAGLKCPPHSAPDLDVTLVL